MRLLYEIAIFQTVKPKVIISLFETVRLSVSISLRNRYNSLNSIKEGELDIHVSNTYVFCVAVMFLYFGTDPLYWIAVTTVGDFLFVLSFAFLFFVDVLDELHLRNEFHFSEVYQSVNYIGSRAK